MIATCLCILFGVAIYVAIGEGATGPAILGVVIILVILLGASSVRKDTKAWANRRDYWANGGPKR